MKNFILLSLVAALVSSCTTVTISSREKYRLSSEPTYQASLGFWLGGLVGEKEFDVVEACNGANPLQVQTQHTATDVLIFMVTLGIYSPRSVRVWCPKKTN
ncbi:MAG: Bor family protein [Bdellovibrionaceae bacterium]|nr:Bor family protein [Pseudobdellovibrionaceae bacterium]